MSKGIDPKHGYLRWLHELLFSIYLPFVVVSAHEGLGQRWAVRFLFFLVSHGHVHASTGIEDYRVDIIDFWFVWLSAALMFVLLRLFARFPLTIIVLRSVPAFVAVAGFPLASKYVRSGHMLSPDIGLLSAGVCLVLFLWAYRKWQIPMPLNIALLSLYFAVWAIPVVGGSSLRHASLILFWPSWSRSAHGIWEYGWLSYPLLGFCSTLLWAAYFKRSDPLIHRTSHNISEKHIVEPGRAAQT